MHFWHWIIALLGYISIFLVRVGLAMTLSDSQNSEETCVFNLVVPKDSISSSCRNEKVKGFTAKVEALESRIESSERRVHFIEYGRLPLIITETRMLKTSNSRTENIIQMLLDEKKILEEKVQTLEDKVDELADRVNQDIVHDSLDRHLDPIKPLLVAEFEKFKAHFIRNVLEELGEKHNQSQYNIETIAGKTVTERVKATLRMSAVHDDENNNDLHRNISTDTITAATLETIKSTTPTMATTTTPDLTISTTLTTTQSTTTTQPSSTTLTSFATIKNTSEATTQKMLMTNSQTESEEISELDNYIYEDYNTFEDFWSNLGTNENSQENKFTDLVAENSSSVQETPTILNDVKETTTIQNENKNTIKKNYNRENSNRHSGSITSTHDPKTSVGVSSIEINSRRLDDVATVLPSVRDNTEYFNFSHEGTDSREDSMVTVHRSDNEYIGKGNLNVEKTSVQPNVINSRLQQDTIRPKSQGENSDGNIAAMTDASVVALILSRLDQLESKVTELQKNHTNLSSLGDNLNMQLLGLETKFVNVKNSISIIKRQIDSPANNVFPMDQVRVQMNHMRQDIEENVRREFLSELTTIENKVLMQERGINLTNNLIGIMKTTLQTQDERIRNLQSNFESQLARLEKTVTKPASLELESERRFEDFENRFVELEMQQNFAHTRIENLKDVTAKVDRDSGIKFREIQQEINMFTNQLGEISKLNLSIQVLDVKYTTLVSRVNTVESTANTLYIKQKLQSGEWMNYNFTFNSVNNKCYGHQYVKRNPISRDTEGRFVGVSLCNETRYKIFLGNALDSEFYDIGDFMGHCEDHCEFVGGTSERHSKVDPGYPFYEPTQGFARGNWGEVATMSLLSPILKPTVGWYECGVTIP